MQPNGVASYLWARDRGTTAARFAWLLVYGDAVPASVLLKRRCGNVRCVRPDHGIPYRPAQRIAQVHALLAQGLKQREVAARLDMPLGTVGWLATRRVAA